MSTEIGIEGDSFHGVHQANQAPTDTIAPEPVKEESTQQDTEQKIMSEPDAGKPEPLKLAPPLAKKAAKAKPKARAKKVEKSAKAKKRR